MKKQQEIFQRIFLIGVPAEYKKCFEDQQVFTPWADDDRMPVRWLDEIEKDFKFSPTRNEWGFHDDYVQYRILHKGDVGIVVSTNKTLVFPEELKRAAVCFTCEPTDIPAIAENLKMLIRTRSLSKEYAKKTFTDKLLGKIPLFL